MNVVDLILVAILACVTLHFYFRKKKKALSSGKEKEKPIREASLLLPEKEESPFFRKGEREADKGGGAQGRAGESLSGHLRGISA